jgi:uncharacterized protein
MKIQLGGLSEGTHQFHFQAGPAEIGLGDTFVNDLTVDVTLEKTGTQLFLTAAIEAEGKFLCDRCVSEFVSALPSSYHMYYVTEGVTDQHMDSSEMQVVPPGLSTLDIAEDVRQTIVLSVPLKLLCSETCKGLCPRCGRNRNIEACVCAETVTDPRWEQLRMLKTKNAKNVG